MGNVYMRTPGHRKSVDRKSNRRCKFHAIPCYPILFHLGLACVLELGVQSVSLLLDDRRLDEIEIE